MVKVFYHSAPFEITFARFDVQNMLMMIISGQLVLAPVGCFLLCVAGLLLSGCRPLSDLMCGPSGAVPGRAV